MIRIGTELSPRKVGSGLEGRRFYLHAREGAKALVRVHIRGKQEFLICIQSEDLGTRWTKRNTNTEG